MHLIKSLFKMVCSINSYLALNVLYLSPTVIISDIFYAGPCLAQKGFNSNLVPQTPINLYNDIDIHIEYI